MPKNQRHFNKVSVSKAFKTGFSISDDDDDIIDDDCDDEDEDCEDDDDEDEETYSETDGALDFNDYYSFNEDLDDIGGMGSSAGEGTSASTSGLATNSIFFCFLFVKTH